MVKFELVLQPMLHLDTEESTEPHNIDSPEIPINIQKLVKTRLINNIGKTIVKESLPDLKIDKYKFVKNKIKLVVSPIRAKPIKTVDWWTNEVEENYGDLAMDTWMGGDIYIVRETEYICGIELFLNLISFESIEG